MNPKDVMSITTEAEFYELLNTLLLTDRQREIFILKYKRGFLSADIAAALEPEVCRNTVTKDLKIIREKLARYSRMKQSGKS